MTVKEIREKLSDRNLRVIAKRTGIHYMTVYRIATGRSANPTLRVANKLIQYFEANR